MSRFFGIIFGICLVCASLVFPTFAPFGTTFEPTPSPTPVPSCANGKGLVNEYQFDSTTLEKPFYLRVYTPPCFDRTGRTSYPVLYLLHGSSYNDDQWDRLGVDETADSLISNGTVDPLIIVMPRESAYNEDTHTSRYGDALVDEVLPWVEEQYPTRADRQYRAIGGLSRGAGWAIRIGLSHPDLFGSIGSHSLAFLAGDYYSVPTWRQKTEADLLPRIYLDLGLKDDYKDSARKFETRLSEYSYPHEWHLNLGSHTESYWSSHVKEYLVWYSQGWMGLP